MANEPLKIEPVKSSLDNLVEDPHDNSTLTPSETVETQGLYNCYMTNCGGSTEKTCVICKKPMCERHTSESDSEACTSCMDFQALELKKEPLVDDEGVTHEGAKITPIGLTYRTLTTRISQMDDFTLERHIDFVKKQVREAEAVLDYRRIDLAASQVELEERGVAKKKHLRLKTAATIASIASKNGTLSQTSEVDKQKQKQLDAVTKKLKEVATLFGLPCKTPEDIAKIALIVQGMRNGNGGKK